MSKIEQLEELNKLISRINDLKSFPLDLNLSYIKIKVYNYSIVYVHEIKDRLVIDYLLCNGEYITIDFLYSLAKRLKNDLF